jgi:hypothetical protein
MGSEQPIRYDQPQHRVAEELQPLVGGQATVLVRVRAVGQGTVESLVAQFDAEAGSQLLQERLS